MRRQLSCLITVVLITTMAPTVSWPPRSHGPHGLMASTASMMKPAVVYVPVTASLQDVLHVGSNIALYLRVSSNVQLLIIKR